MQTPSIGDAPINAKPDYHTPEDVTYVACVLVGDWPGSSRAVRERCPDLGAHYVQHLYAAVSKYAPINRAWRFVCFTDRLMIPGVPTRPIPHGMYSYFNKLYCFAPGEFPLGARVLFFDLDTSIVANWGPLAEVPLDKIVMLKDIWAQELPASGVMSWRVSAETDKIWNDFEPVSTRRPPFYRQAPLDFAPIKYFRGAQRFDATPAPAPRRIDTDEHWLQHYLLPDKWVAWQKLLPGALVSFKYQVQRSMRANGQCLERMTESEARAVRVVYWHGNPRPHTFIAPWNTFTRGIID